MPMNDFEHHLNLILGRFLICLGGYSFLIGSFLFCFPPPDSFHSFNSMLRSLRWLNS